MTDTSTETDTNTPGCERCGHPLWASQSVCRGRCEACHIATTGQSTAHTEWMTGQARPAR
jgi:hypothetical protein